MLEMCIFFILLSHIFFNCYHDTTFNNNIDSKWSNLTFKIGYSLSLLAKQRRAVHVHPPVPVSGTRIRQFQCHASIYIYIYIHIYVCRARASSNSYVVHVYIYSMFVVCACLCTYIHTFQWIPMLSIFLISLCCCLYTTYIARCLMDFVIDGFIQNPMRIRKKNWV